MNNSPDPSISNEYPIEVYKGFNHQEELEIRQKLILQIKYDLLRQGIVADEPRLISELVKRGHHLDIPSLQNDLISINRKNRYVANLAIHNYSAYIEDIMCDLHGVIRVSNEIIAKKWTSNKTISTEEKNENGSIVKKQMIVTDEIPGPKIQALKIKLAVLKKCADVFNGGVIDASIALAQIDADKFAAEMKKLRQEKQELEERNETLQNERDKLASTVDAATKISTQ